MNQTEQNERFESIRYQLNTLGYRQYRPLNSINLAVSIESRYTSGGANARPEISFAPPDKYNFQQNVPIY